MFSTIGQILKTPRMAEHTDTRQELHRHDPEYQRRRKNNGRDVNEESTDNETTTVSVEALEIFLKNFLKTTGNQRKQDSSSFSGEDRRQADRKATPAPEIQQEMNLGEDSRKKSAAAARAAYAYQSMAHSNQKEKILLETTDQGAGPEFELNAADVRTILELLEDIKTLSDKGIEYLRIERAETFLDSLTGAVQKALNPPIDH